VKHFKQTDLAALKREDKWVEEQRLLEQEARAAAAQREREEKWEQRRQAQARKAVAPTSAQPSAAIPMMGSLFGKAS
jgi:hypothetical protein